MARARRRAPVASAGTGRAAWEATARQALGSKFDGAAAPLLVGPPDDPDGAFLSGIGFPGEPPFTRGIHPTMYRGRLWTFRQYSGFGSAEATNRRFRFLLGGGQTGLSVAFDLPTQNGYDSDHPKSRGEVGRCGVPIASLGDMRTLFAGLPLDRVTVSMTINATAPILVPLLVAVAEEQGVPRARVAGTVQNDILKEYVARGTYIYPPEASLRLAVDLIEFANREMPQWNTISVSGYHMREAGATAAQEVAFTIANAIAYVRAIAARGLDVDAFLPRVSFFFSADLHFLEEVAKFRAARRLWAKVVRTVFASRSARSQQLRFHVQTAGSSLTAQQPELNVVRTTLEALSAVLGGGQSLHTNALDEAIGLPTEPSARLALRTQQILAEESGAASTVDPLAGAYAIEEATDRIEREADAYLAKVEGMGGALAAVERGYFAAEIAREAYRVARAREARQELVVGVNAFPEGNPEFSLFAKGGRGVRGERIGAGEEAGQVARLRQWRSERDGAAATAALADLERSTSAGENVVPAVVAAVKARATLGEIADVWRRLFGEQPPSTAF
ncbi:MAG TPA: methylmalonyl-CoA mutase family protein [Thermoplasmata archaeon]|nr:methylmalonyl-CoA mutase family protein [Thermoplasmata archaeon]